MNKLLEMLSGGDLRSDVRGNEVADEVLSHPHLFSDLVEGLSAPNDVVRARTAHALERVSRRRPKMLLKLLPRLMQMSLDDPVPMVRWHLVMILGNLPLPAEGVTRVVSTLMRMLEDESAFVRSWSIASLTILGLRHETQRRAVADAMRLLQNDERASVRNRAGRALGVLLHGEPMPAGWVKSSGESECRRRRVDAGCR
jgi:HEAT repeat protein